jgi:hypothetical protein
MGSLMIELTQDWDYVLMILIAAGVGAIGGFGGELLMSRADNTGTVETPGRLAGTRFVDIGFPASLILGAIAAVAILYFFPPVVETITAGANGAEPETTQEYDVVKLVALSLIVGSGGPAFLQTAQSRIIAAVNAQTAASKDEAGKTAVDQINASAVSGMPGAVMKAVTEHAPGIPHDTLTQIAESASQSLGEILKPQVDVAKEQIAAVGPAQSP